MKKIEYEYLKEIKALNLPKTMDDNQKASYLQELDMFIETLPGKTYEMTKLLIVRDYEFLAKALNEMITTLNRLHAYEAAESCSCIVELVNNRVEKSKIDVFLEKLTAKLSTLSIEIQLAQHKSRERIHTESPMKGNPQSQKNILAVDDDPIILNTLKSAIDSERYKFIGAVSGQNALRYLETHTPPDLIILDIEMPGIDGYELAERITAKGFDMPIIFLTSNATRAHVLKAIQAGACDFLVKPADEELILSKLKQHLA